MTRFSEHLPAEIEVHESDRDSGPVTFRGDRLTEERAESVPDDILKRAIATGHRQTARTSGVISAGSTSAGPADARPSLPANRVRVNLESEDPARITERVIAAAHSDHQPEGLDRGRDAAVEGQEEGIPEHTANAISPLLPPGGSR